jgi:hypothetical protein
MTTVKRFEVGDTKCLDDGSRTQALLISGGNGAIISLMFGSASRKQVRELERTIAQMELTVVEVQTEESNRGGIS